MTRFPLKGFISSIFLFSTLILINSCDVEVVTPPDCEIENITYNEYIKSIVETTCYTSSADGSSCHINGGVAPGNYEDYSDIVSSIEDGSFQRVLDRQNMPYPEDKQLSEEEMQLINCWIANNYPE